MSEIKPVTEEMPKILRYLGRALAWVFVGLYLIVVSPLLILSYPFYLKRRRKLRRLAAQRDLDATFVRFCAGLGEYEESRIRRVYELLQSFIMIDHFPILPQDDLCDDLYCDVGELDSYLFDEFEGALESSLSSKAGELAKQLLRYDKEKTNKA